MADNKNQQAEARKAEEARRAEAERQTEESGKNQPREARKANEATVAANEEPQRGEATRPLGATAAATERYVLGDEAGGHREMHVIRTGNTHPFDGMTPVAATHATAKFPYTGS